VHERRRHTSGYPPLRHRRHHGRADLLRLLLAQIAEDAAGRPPAVQQLIYLGDYVDRGRIPWA